MRDGAVAGVRRYAAVREGSLAGGAGLRFVDGIAQFAGAATAPAHRRRGIQNAMLSVRLTEAIAEGCDLAVIVAQPGSKSHQTRNGRVSTCCTPGPSSSNRLRPSFDQANGRRLRPTDMHAGRGM